MTPRLQINRGFTLVELAVVLAIISVVMGMGLRMANAMLENMAASDTRAKQANIKTALIAYLRTNRRLPCPASTAAVPSGSEESAPCPDSFGVVPWITLGLSRDAALDGWGNFISYKVQPSWMALSTLDMNQVSTPTLAISVQEAGASITQYAVVVLISHGSNGYGAASAKVSGRASTTGATTEEITNAAAGTTYALRPAAANVAAFDDVVSYLLQQDILAPLANEGTLKVCRAYCGVASCLESDGSVSSAPGASCSCPNGPGVPGSPTTACTVAGRACSLCVTPATATCGTGANVILPIGHSPITCL